MLLSLNFEVLCNMYDLYKDYNAALSSHIQPDDALHVTFSAAQYVTWKAMQSAY